MASRVINQYRAQNPALAEKPDYEIAREIYKSSYSDIEFSDFADRVGLAPLDRVRAENPGKAGADDLELATELYQQSYSDLDFQAFANRIGISIPEQSNEPAAQSNQDRSAETAPSDFSELPDVNQPLQSDSADARGNQDRMTVGEAGEALVRNLKGVPSALEAGAAMGFGSSAEGAGLIAQQFSNTEYSRRVDNAVKNLRTVQENYAEAIQGVEDPDRRAAIEQNFNDLIADREADLQSAVDDWSEREPNQAAEFFRTIGDELQGWAQSRLQDGPASEMNPVTRDLATGTGSFLTYVGPGVATNLLTRGAPKLTRDVLTYTTSLSLASTQGVSDQYQRAIGAGLSEEEAVERSIGGIPGGAVQVAPVASILRPLPVELRGKALGQLATILRTAGSEALAESSGVILQNLVERSYNPERGVWDDSLYNAAIGGGVGGIVQLGIQLATRGRGIGGTGDFGDADPLDGIEIRGPETETPGRQSDPNLRLPGAVIDQAPPSDSVEGPDPDPSSPQGPSEAFEAIDREIEQIRRDVIGPSRDPSSPSPSPEALADAEQRVNALLEQRAQLTPEVDSDQLSRQADVSAPSEISSLDDIQKQISENQRQISLRRNELERQGLPTENDAEIDRLSQDNELASSILTQAQERAAEQSANEAIDAGRAPVNDALGRQVESARLEAGQRSPLQDEIQRLRQRVESTDIASGASPETAPEVASEATPQLAPDVTPEVTREPTLARETDGPTVSASDQRGEVVSEDATFQPIVRANGQPFSSEASVRRSAPFRNASNPEIVPVGQGFGFIDRGGQTESVVADNIADPPSPEVSLGLVPDSPEPSVDLPEPSERIQPPPQGQSISSPTESTRDNVVTPMRNPRDEARYQRSQISQEMAYQMERLIDLESQQSPFNRSRIEQTRRTIDGLAARREAIDAQYPDLAGAEAIDERFPNLAEFEQSRASQGQVFSAPDRFTEAMNQALDLATDDVWLEDLSIRIEEQGDQAVTDAVNDLEEVVAYGVTETLGRGEPNQFEREIIRQRAQAAVEQAVETGEVPSFSRRGPDDAVFSRSDEPSAGLSADEAMGYVDGLMSEWANAPGVVVAQSESDLPAGLQGSIARAKAGGQIRGAFYNGQVYVIADNASSRAEVEEVIFHEIVRHYGMRQVLGENYGQFMDDVYKKVGRSAIKPFAAYTGLNLDAKDARERRNARRLATEELLAHTTEEELGSRLWTRLVNAVTEWLRRMGFRIQLTGAEIRDVLQRAKMYVQDGEFVTGTSVVEKSRVYRGEQHPEADAVFSKKHLDSESDQFNFNADRGQRNRAQRVKLSASETSLLKEEANKAGLNPALVLARARSQKANYPVKDGWQALEVIGLEVKNKDAGTFSIQYKKIPYEFNKRKTDKRSRNKDPELARRIARKLVREVTRVIERSNAGDSDAAVILRQAQWYEAMITRLRGEFGGFSDIFADLLGATSPNTPVADNWANTVDILRRFVRGDFDAQLEALESWLESGGTVAQFKQELPDELITKISGKKYGMNSDKAMKALLGLWRAVQAGDAPKARNFAMNLIGQSDAATIDVWAARLLQRLAGYGRIPPLAEGAVSGSITQAMRPGGQFGFGQDVFEIAADLLSDSGVEINPRSLQAVAWFLEKEIWTKNGWTNRSGEGGSFEQQMDAMPTKNWQAGYSITQDQPPTNASMAEEVNRFEPVLSADENVYFYRMIPTQGLYAGEGERAFDHEVVAHPDWDPSDWIRKLAEGGKANNQLDVFVSRKITDPNEDVPNARPGMEVYFREPLSAEDTKRVMDAVREQGVDGFTLTVSPLERRNTADGSEPGAYTGFRVQYVPEIAIRAYEYGWSDSSDPAVQSEYEALTSGDFERVNDAFSEAEARMAKAIQAVSPLPEVAYSEIYEYDTQVIGQELYDAIIRSDQATDLQAGEGRSKQQVAEGLKAAAQRIRSGQRQDAEGDLVQRGSEPPSEPVFSRVRRAPFRFSEEERSVGPTGFERGTGGTDSSTRGVGQKESAEADLRRVAEENKRSDVTQGESLEGDGRGFTDFFRTVTNGADPTFQPVSPYKPAIPLTPRVQAFKEVRAQYRGNFDDHIATSIPGFDEVQSIVGQAIVDTFDGENASVLDVGTSEGALIKAISESSDGRISALGIDPNPWMEKSFSRLPQSEGAMFSLSAFGSAQEAGKVAWTEDDGTDIPFFDPQGQKFDVVHEAMVFQFISNARNAQVSRVKDLMKPGGIAIFEQKFGDIATRSDAAEDQKDFEWKSEFYTKEQIEAKRRAVLQRGGDDVEGMNNLMVAHWEMEEVLTNNFDNVVQFWESGNFRGYAASDDRALLEAFIGNMQSTDSRFAREQMPKEISTGDDAVFMRRNEDPDLDEARQLAGLGGRRKPISEFIKSLQAVSFDKIRDFNREAGHAVAQGAFDRFHGIKRIEQRTVGNLPAEQSAYVAARLSTGIATVMRGILHYGTPQWSDGVLSRVDGSKGLLEILDPVRGEIDTFLGWMVARRASRLYAEGRENLFEPRHIEALLDAAEQSPLFDQFERVGAELDMFKKSVLDVAEESGLIDPEARLAWDHSDYIPFYRIADDAPSAQGPSRRQALSGQTSGIRTLRGGVSRLNDPLENLIMNFTHLLDASMKNHAILQLRDNVEGFEGILEEVGPQYKSEMIPMNQVREQIIRSGGDPSVIPQEAMQGLAKMWAMKPPADDDVIRVMDKGKARYYRVLDPLLLKSLTAIHDNGLRGLPMDFMRWTKRLLTRGVTADPEFMARNFIRDMMHAWTINEDKFRLGVDSIRGAAKTVTESGGTIDMMFAGGSFLGGYVNATDPREVARATRQALRQKGYSAASANRFMSTVIDSPLKLWEVYTRFGDSIENASREAVYEAARREGRSRAEAVFRAKDLMDYSMRGSNPAIQFFTDVVPFLNARLQGLYKLGRAGVNNPGPVLAKGSVIMLATLALLFDNKDDERYEELPDWDKDTYWHFFPPQIFEGMPEHIRIPKPFEIGVMFGTIPERIAMRALGNEDNEKTFERMLWAINSTFAFNPMPQAVFPMLEVFANRSVFTGAPIENLADQNRLPEARYSPYTSETMRALGQYTGPSLGLSPKELQHIWRGYTGTLGMYALGVADLVTRTLNGDPPKPAMRIDRIPVVGGFIRGQPAISTQFQTDLYDLFSEARQIQRTINAYVNEENISKAERLLEENERMVAALPDLRSTARELGVIRDEITQIYQAPDMTPEEKRDAIDELVSLRNEITRSQVKSIQEFLAEDPLKE